MFELLLFPRAVIYVVGPLWCFLAVADAYGGRYVESHLYAPTANFSVARASPFCMRLAHFAQMLRLIFI